MSGATPGILDASRWCRMLTNASPHPVPDPTHPKLHSPHPTTPRSFLRVLGPVSAERAGRPVNLGRPQARTVLAVLVLAQGRVVSVDRLFDAIWDGAPPSSGKVQLQGHISALRRALGARSALDPASPIVTEHSGYRLRLLDGQLDLDVFRSRLADARRLRSSDNASQAARRLREALELWNGEPFADIVAPTVRNAAAHLAELRLVALEDRIDADLASGAAGHLVPELKQLVAEHPFRERLWSHLIRALVHAACTADALATYREVWRLFDRELGIAPSATLQRLHQMILNGEPVAMA
jgi:DNA-binding SARP family transcriptional activator